MNSMKYDRKILRKIIKYLTDPEFDESLDGFPRVREQFTRGMDKNHKITIILNYFENTRLEFNKFLDDIKDCNSTVYENYISQLEEPHNLFNKTSDVINIEELEKILPQEDNFFWQCVEQVYQEFLFELDESNVDENPKNLLALLWELELLSEQEVIQKFITRLIAYLSVCHSERYQNNLRKLRKWTIGKIEREIFRNQLKRFTQEYNQQPFIYPVKVFNFQTPTVNRAGEIIKRETKQAQYFTEDLPNNIPLEMVYIAGGTFMMGTEDEEVERLIEKYRDKVEEYFRWEQPRHEVTVPPFFMGKYLITQEQWKAVANLPRVDRELDPQPSRFKENNQKNNLPVEQVSWYDAEEFCKRLSKYTGKQYRLASEAEWEYACRAGTTTQFHFGDTITGELANYYASYTFADEPKGEYRGKTTPVSKFPPNAFGLYDMHGNAWEWCQDPWHDNYEGAPKDGSIWIDENIDSEVVRVLRGGSWYSDPGDCRSASRTGYNPDYRRNGNGFRVVCGVSPQDS